MGAPGPQDRPVRRLTSWPSALMLPGCWRRRRARC
ncbi:GlyGly-CTERM sorting domain-containing protein [Janthinobacterium agaricidamnosum]|uniref:GlyGly-CTERM sorting domain-containing protein n=1 Tax=Janthinobacterium agaricidamnosum TaxID=55508 RepID=A0A3G2EI92_9BURK|nr:GlyGly-CTERM sorting domain-containing protein [Janthinobacterium agaricidamnosum]MCC7684575.1 GlyGly-CTERM sorting domain-containing protein [Janthinobacterium sp. FW305-128]